MFDELLATLRSGEFPETIYDDLGAAYKSLAESGNAAVAEYKAIVAAQEAEIQKLKAHNYELMMSSAAPANPLEESDSKDDVEESYEGEGESFDDLFSDDEKDDEK